MLGRIRAAGASIQDIARCRRPRFAGLGPALPIAFPQGASRACPKIRAPQALRPLCGSKPARLASLARSLDLGYTAEQIAGFLSLDVAMVKDFLSRLEPLRPRRCRVSPDRRVNPRGHDEDRQARLTLQRAKTSRQPQQENQGVDDRRQRMHLHRSPVDAWGPRHGGRDRRIREASGRREERCLSGSELLGLASRAFTTVSREPRRRRTCIARDLDWPRVTGGHSMKLTAEQIIEAADMLRRGMPWTEVARHFGVAENTLRRCIAGIGPRRVAA